MALKPIKKIALPRYKMAMSAEKYDELFLQDIETQNRRSQYTYKDIHKRVIRASKFPMRYLLKEQHGLEEYRAYAKIDSKKQILRDGIEFTSVTYFKNSKGLCAYTNLDPFNVVPKSYQWFNAKGFAMSHRYLFTPHFFERYEMRYGWDEGFSDIRNQFFFNNVTFSSDGFYIQVTNARPNDYKKYDVWGLCEDGLMLGEIKNESDFEQGKPYVMQMNTYLDIETLTKRQDKYADLLAEVKKVFATINIEESESSLAKRSFMVEISKL